MLQQSTLHRFSIIRLEYFYQEFISDVVKFY
jgi:hypothetical protein